MVMDGKADLSAVRADDELLDKIGGGLSPVSDDPLVALLVAWRKECREAPFRPLNGQPLDVAMSRWRRRMWWRRLGQRVTFGWWPR